MLNFTYKLVEIEYFFPIQVHWPLLASEGMMILMRPFETVVEIMGGKTTPLRP